jgi:hypothetical protein
MSMTCPRRRENGMDRDDSPLTLSGQNLDEWRTDDTCSYCGSVSQETLFKCIEAGAEIGPTDKSYKIYVRGGDAPGPMPKFYFQHLDEEGRKRFIDLVNEQKMNIGYPHHFYVLPYFAHPVSSEESSS